MEHSYGLAGPKLQKPARSFRQGNLAEDQTLALLLVRRRFRLRGVLGNGLRRGRDGTPDRFGLSRRARPGSPQVST